MNEEKKPSWLQKISSVISKSSVGFVIVVTLFSIFIPDILSDIIKDFSQHYRQALFITGFIYLILIIVTVTLCAIIFSISRNKEINEILKKKPQECLEIQKNLHLIQESANQLQSLASDKEFSTYVLSREKVNKIEESVKKGKRIIILTSKFVLEKDTEFVERIINNFRKGVKYIYYVPDDELQALNTYWESVKEWFNAFASFTQSKEEAEKLLSETDDGIVREWNQEYVNLIKRFIRANKKKKSKGKDKEFQSVWNKLIEMFTGQLKSYLFIKHLFFVTVAMYEQESEDWKAIIKLPTVTPKEQYVAFSLDRSEKYEREEFFTKIIYLRSIGKELTIPPQIFQNQEG